MKYRVVAKPGLVVFECGYRYTSGSCISQTLRKNFKPECRTIRKDVS